MTGIAMTAVAPGGSRPRRGTPKTTDTSAGGRIMSDSVPSGHSKRWYQHPGVGLLLGVLVFLYVIGATTSGTPQSARSSAGATSTTAITKAAVRTPTTNAAGGGGASAVTRCDTDPQGNCYRAGKDCPDSLHRQTVRGEEGFIICLDDKGWRWEKA
jgi:hypothetical protein